LHFGTTHRWRQYPSVQLHKATPIATTLSQHLPPSFFSRTSEVFAPELIGCLLVKRKASGSPQCATRSPEPESARLPDITLPAL
jgi:hypothetical protein